MCPAVGGVTFADSPSTIEDARASPCERSFESVCKVVAARAATSTSPSIRVRILRTSSTTPYPHAIAWRLPTKTIDTYDASDYETQLIRAVESVLSPLDWDREDIRATLAATSETELGAFGLPVE